MVKLQRKRFSDPIEVRDFPGGRVEVVELDDVVVGRMTMEPGWRWSVNVRPLAATDRCQYHHMGVTLSGRLHVELGDGAQLEVGPGDVYEFPPDHDAWVVGDEPWVAVDFAGVRTYARPPERRVERTLAALLFTDIVDSTAAAASVGEEAWRERIGLHNERAQAIVDRFGGRIVQLTGDGILARFDGAERAVRAALAMRPRINDLGLQIRQGIHSGEVEVRGDKLRGLAVHIAARVMALAGADEIWVSSTIRDLLDGTDIEFEDRGRHALKGLTGERELFAIKG